jgi:hypothetical protein
MDATKVQLVSTPQGEATLKEIRKALIIPNSNTLVPKPADRKMADVILKNLNPKDLNFLINSAAEQLGKVEYQGAVEVFEYIMMRSPQEQVKYGLQLLASKGYGGELSQIARRGESESMAHTAVDAMVEERKLWGSLKEVIDGSDRFLAGGDVKGIGDYAKLKFAQSLTVPDVNYISEMEDHNLRDSLMEVGCLHGEDGIAKYSIDMAVKNKNFNLLVTVITSTPNRQVKGYAVKMVGKLIMRSIEANPNK